MTIFQVALRRRQVWFFNEALSKKCLVPISFTHRISKTNIAIARFGRGRFNTKRHEIALLGQLIGKSQRLMKRFNIGNYRVGME